MRLKNNANRPAGAAEEVGSGVLAEPVWGFVGPAEEAGVGVGLDGAVGVEVVFPEDLVAGDVLAVLGVAVPGVLGFRDVGAIGNPAGDVGDAGLSPRLSPCPFPLSCACDGSSLNAYRCVNRSVSKRLCHKIVMTMKAMASIDKYSMDVWNKYWNKSEDFVSIHSAQVEAEHCCSTGFVNWQILNSGRDISHQRRRANECNTAQDKNCPDSHTIPLTYVLYAGYSEAKYPTPNSDDKCSPSSDFP